MKTWQSDTQFTEGVIASVKKHEDGSYSVERDGWHLLIPNPGFEPKVGDPIRFYGKGIGYPVRGVVIDGKLVYYKTPEEMDAEMKARSDKFEAEVKERDAKAAAAGRDELQMRGSDAPWPKTLEELTAYIKGLSEGPHTYGTCVYAASLATTATFHYVCSRLGMSGFQSSCADLDVLRRTRRYDGPFMVIDARDMLYPQSDPRKKLNDALEEWRPWARERAKEMLKESGAAHPNVLAHWKKLAE